MKNNLIGVAGLARSGKNIFFDLFKYRLNKISPNTFDIQQFALADKIKCDLHSFTKLKYGISAFTEKTKEKNIIRPLLIAHGDTMREISNGAYWIRKVEEDIKLSKFNSKLKRIVGITDIRFTDKKVNELDWIKKNKGILVHVSKYKVIDGEKVFAAPPNEVEAYNDPILKSNADFLIEWEDCDEDAKVLEDKYSYVIDSFIEFYLSKIT